jgi:hypothetical protein
LFLIKYHTTHIEFSHESEKKGLFLTLNAITKLLINWQMSPTVLKNKNTLTVEVTNISAHGFWILMNENEYFLAYANFPWFKNATANDICDIHLLNEQHLYWKKMDVDVELSSIINPENYPLIYK